MSAKSLDTAYFLDQMNTCFDLVNLSSAFGRDPSKVTVNRASLLSRKADLEQFAHWIANWKVISRKDGKMVKWHEFSVG